MAEVDESVRRFLDAVYIKSCALHRFAQALLPVVGASVILAFLVFVFCAVVSLYLLVTLPFEFFNLPADKAQEAIKNFLLTFAGVFGAPLLVWRAWVAHRQAKASAQQAHVAFENHVTGIFSKSIELMGHIREERYVGADGNSVSKSAPNIEARLGALYSLERLWLDSRKDQKTIL